MLCASCGKFEPLHVVAAADALWFPSFPKDGARSLGLGFPGQHTPTRETSVNVDLQPRAGRCVHVKRMFKMQLQLVLPCSPCANAEMR